MVKLANSQSDDTATKAAAQRVMSLWDRMKNDRMFFMIQWDQISRYCTPRKGNILTKYYPGRPQTIDLYDVTAEQAGDIFAAGCVTHICPAGEKWLRLESRKKNPPATVADWYSAATDRVIDVIMGSNFYESIHEAFHDAGHFNTCAVQADEDDKEVVNFINPPVGSYAVLEDNRGRVDTFCREWKWTARQAAQQWGEEALGRQQRDALNSKDTKAELKQFTYLHLIEPRMGVDRNATMAVASKRPIRSVFVCVEDVQVIVEEGYYTMPVFVDRLLRSNGEMYGRGPGMNLLPVVRQVNAMRRDYLIAMEKLANPGWLVGDDQTAELDNRPNGINYWDTSNPAGKPEQLQLKNNVDKLQQDIEAERENIRRGYYNDLFQMLTNLEESKREKTAYEVQQMVAEKLLLFSPLFGRITKELMNPLIERVFDIMARRSMAAWAMGQDGLLPLPPAEIRDYATFDVAYVSRIALAIKAANNQSFATMLTLVEQAAAVDPESVHVVKIADGVRQAARNVGLPAELLRSEREVRARVAAIQEQQQAAMGPANAELATRAAKNLGPEAQQAASRAIISAHGRAA